MNNKRANFIYELTGIITGKQLKKDKNGNVFFHLTTKIDNPEKSEKKEKIKYLLLFKNSLKDPKIWEDVENSNYHRKEYIFFCHNYMGIYRISSWRQIDKKGEEIRD